MLTLSIAHAPGPTVLGPMINLCRGRKEQRQLELSSHHFLNAQRKQGGFAEGYRHLRAKDVRTGDKVQIIGTAGLEEAEVVSIEWTSKQGLWNPYTIGGNIVVNGVVASSHSEWIFDPLFDWLGQTEHLPAFYQVAPHLCRPTATAIQVTATCLAANSSTKRAVQNVCVRVMLESSLA